MSIESVMPSNHLILCRPLLLPSIFPSIRVFFNESVSSGGQSIGASASASVLPMNIQDWLPLGVTGLISLQSTGNSKARGQRGRERCWELCSSKVKCLSCLSLFLALSFSLSLSHRHTHTHIHTHTHTHGYFSFTPEQPSVVTEYKHSASTDRKLSCICLFIDTTGDIPRNREPGQIDLLKVPTF